MKKIFVTFFAFLTPFLIFAQAPAAQTGSQQTAQGFIKNAVLFLNGTIVPFLLGIAFLIFVINVVRFFILQSNNEDGQKAARALATYSVLAFVIIVIFWGLVNMLASSLNLTTGGAPTSDYVNQTQEPGTVPPARQPSGTGNRSTTNPNQNQRPNTPTFTPPADAPVQPPPISDDLEGAPDPLEDPFLRGGPAEVDLRP